MSFDSTCNVISDAILAWWRYATFFFFFFFADLCLSQAFLLEINNSYIFISDAPALLWRWVPTRWLRAWLQPSCYEGLWRSPFYTVELLNISQFSDWPFINNVVTFTSPLIIVTSIWWCYLDQLHLSRLMTKPTLWPVRPAKTQISLGIWSESSQCAHWVDEDPMFLHADSESDQNQNCLLVTRLNDNHSTGPCPGRLVPNSHQRSESNTILDTFSRGDKRVWKCIPVPYGLGKKTTLINIRVSNGDLICHRMNIPAAPNQGDKVICWYTGFTLQTVV